MAAEPVLADVSEGPVYNTAAVVKRTGVGATTIRAWERRYGYPKPQRDVGGQRLYSERDIQAIIWLAEQTTRGVAISRAVNMLRSGYVELESLERGQPAAHAGARSFEALRGELGRMLLAFDANGAEAILAEAFALYSVEEVCLHVLEPLLVDVGDRWRAGELSVGDEHYVTSFVRSRLFALLNAYQPVDTRAALVFTACAPEEWHEVGILLVSLFLARRGFEVRYLGPNLPLDGLAAVASQHHPVLVVVSAQNAVTARGLGPLPELLRQGPPPHPQFAFGGQAFNAHPKLRDAVDGTYVGPDAAASAEAIVQLVERASTAARRRSRSGSRRSR